MLSLYCHPVLTHITERFCFESSFVFKGKFICREEAHFSASWTQACSTNSAFLCPLVVITGTSFISTWS